MPARLKAWHDHPVPTPPIFRLLAGGTAPDDVAALCTTLTERMVQRGLLPTHDGRVAAGAGDGADERAESPLPLLVPIGPGEDAGQVRADLARRVARVPPHTDLILRTSGSTTGTGRLIAVRVAALTASALATHERLGGPGTWLLALPAHHVAGLQILVRSLLSGTTPVVADMSVGFSPTALADALRSARDSAGPAARLYTSLVPTQLVRVVRDRAASRALTEADAVLLGGAAADPALLARAQELGITVVTTYGMSETGGGCVYDGRPLNGVELAIQDPDAEGTGRVLISGPVLADGYLQDPDVTDSASAGPASDGTSRSGEGFRDTEAGRVLVTSDRGRLRPDGRLELLGRVDDVIITGGVKVEPRRVEEALTGLDTVAEACVVGLPDEQWGSIVVAAVVCEAAAGQEDSGVSDDLSSPDGAALREAVRSRLDGVHAPKRVIVLEALPLRPSGKVDRRAVTRLLAAASAEAT